MGGGVVCVFFFFKQKTAYEIVSRDWSSDVCSSDLKNIEYKYTYDKYTCNAWILYVIGL